MSSENLRQIHITNINNKPELYIDGLIILDKINSVFFQNAIYRARDNTIVTSTGPKKIIDLVQRGEVVYYLS